MKKFYLTTPIYYPSDKLHIGHAYTTVAADALARFHRLRGEEVFFLTGTDEHGQKIQREAEKRGLAPKAFVDEIVAGIQDLWARLHISYDRFIRTTDSDHREVVQEVFQRLMAKEDVYKAAYEGWYCTPCEAFWTETKLVDGNCPDCGRPVERLREESYFFRLSRYADRLLEHIERHPEFIQPASRRNEMIRFIQNGLEDLSVSRTTFSWGIPLPAEEGHIAYVWVDALTNYLTGIGWLRTPDRFERFWPPDLHLVGKEIVRFHTIIWPILLMALDLPLPHTVFGHGWLLLGESKMSKSKGNVVDPVQLIDKYGVDPVRYFLLREIPFGADGSYTEAALRLRTNVDLANDLGNLLNRTVAMIERFAEGCIPQSQTPSMLREDAEKAVAAVAASMERLDPSGATAAIMQLVGRANKYIDEMAPWNLHRQGDPHLGTVLYDVAESLRIAAILLTPFLVEAPDRIGAQLGLSHPLSRSTWSDTSFGGLVPGTPIRRGEPLFPRLEDEETPVPESPPAVPQEKGPEPIDIATFGQVELRVGRVKAAERVPKTDRLLKLTVDLGTEERTVVSGIAATYSPEDMVGRQVVLVANLKPVTLRGIESQGMILAASGEEGPILLTPERSVPPGSRVK